MVSPLSSIKFIDQPSGYEIKKTECGFGFIKSRGSSFRYETRVPCQGERDFNPWQKDLSKYDFASKHKEKPTHPFDCAVLVFL